MGTQNYYSIEWRKPQREIEAGLQKDKTGSDLEEICQAESGVKLPSRP
jgi:hypothetical protein